MGTRVSRLGCAVRVAVAFCLVLLSVGSVEGAYVWGGVYGWGRPSGTIQYIDEGINPEDLPGVIGKYGELIHESGGPDNGYTLKAQAVLDTDTLQGYIAINNYKVGAEIQHIDAWTNSGAADTYTVTGGAVGDEVEAIFTCQLTGTLSIEPQYGTSPHSHGTASFDFGMHGTYGDPAVIPNWVDAGMYIQYNNGGIEILSNDVRYYDDWDDDAYDLDRHTPVFTALVEGEDYTISGNTVTVNATFEFPVTMVSGHALEVEASLDLTADTSDTYWYPDRGSEVIADFWQSGITHIALAPAYQGTYDIVRASGVPEPSGLSFLAAGMLMLIRRRKR